MKKMAVKTRFWWWHKDGETRRRHELKARQEPGILLAMKIWRTQHLMSSIIFGQLECAKFVELDNERIYKDEFSFGVFPFV